MSAPVSRVIPAYPLGAADASRVVSDSTFAGVEVPGARDFGGVDVIVLDPSWDASAAGGCAYAIGAFDGVHAGHRSLVASTVGDARHRGIRSAAVTFDPDPADVLLGIVPSSRLLSCHDRLRALSTLGLGALVSFPFTRELARTSYRDFVLGGLAPVAVPASIHVGADFRLGRDGRGTVSALEGLGRECGFDVVGEDLVGVGGEAVSATRIRGLLAAGDVTGAAALLGRCHFVRGDVRHGRGEGTGLGFPTANVTCDVRDCLPAEGVYGCFVRVGGHAWPAAVNVGAPPTFSVARPAFLEANLVGFDGDIYGRSVEVVFVERLRASRRFESTEALERAVLDNVQWVRENLGDSCVEVQG